MQYKEIEHFKRFAKCYLEWSHSNFDRIAKDVAAKHLREHLEDRKSRSLSGYGMELSTFPTFANYIMRNIEFLNMIKADNAKLGTTLGIKLPSDYLRPPSNSLRSVLTSFFEKIRSWYVSHG